MAGTPMTPHGSLTTNLGLPYPGDQDDADVPRDIRNLATELDRELQNALTTRLAALEAEITAIKAKNTAQDTALSTLDSRVTRTRAHLYTYSSTTVKNAGGSLSNIYTTTWSVPENGHIMVVGEAEINDQATVAGDPQVRLVLNGSAGPVSTAGIAKGAGAVTITVPVIHSATVSKGNVSVAVQAGATTNTPGTVRNCSLRGIFVANV